MKVLDNHVLEVLQTKKTLDIALNREKVEGRRLLSICCKANIVNPNKVRTNAYLLVACHRS